MDSAIDLLHLFYAIHCSSLFHPLLSFSFSVSISHYLRSFRLLIDIQASHLLIHPFSPLSSPRPIVSASHRHSYASSWLLLTWTSPYVYSLFCCGGAGNNQGLTEFSWWDSACILGVRQDCDVIALPNMQLARGNHAIIEWGSHVYIFGGCKK